VQATIRAVLDQGENLLRVLKAEALKRFRERKKREGICPAARKGEIKRKIGEGEGLKTKQKIKQSNASRQWKRKRKMRTPTSAPEGTKWKTVRTSGHKGRTEIELSEGQEAFGALVIQVKRSGGPRPARTHGRNLKCSQRRKSPNSARNKQSRSISALWLGGLRAGQASSSGSE